jgi:TonB family protein
MKRWFLGRRKSLDGPEEALIRVCLVSRDPALIDEVHKALLIGFSTRGGYEFEGDHPDFQQYCDVLFVDLRAAGLQRDSQQGLAFIDAIRKSVSHPPIVALCDADADGFGREVMQRGAYDKLTAPVSMPQLRLMLQRAYEFRSAEAKLENFLSQETAPREGLPSNPRRPRVVPRPATAVPPVRRARPHAGPSRLAVGFVLGCVLFFAGLVTVRTMLSGMGDALASAGFAADSGGAATGVDAIANEARPSDFVAQSISPLSSSADFSSGAFEANSARHSSLPGYEPAVLIERVTPRYSIEARARQAQGTVRIRAVVGRDGVPRGLARASGDPMLAQIAIDSIALWRYAPATLDGAPVESELIIPIEFKLPD